MIWKQYFNKVYIINLRKRIDRLSESLRILHDYNIEVERYEAIEDVNGAAGLVKTMKRLFTECIEKGYERVLIFEDDLEMLESKERFNEVMDKSCLELSKTEWDIFYLGTNHPAIFVTKFSETLLPVHQGYSTHAAGYSLKAMDFIVNAEINEPVDNYIVRTLQKSKRCYCTFPMLVSQRVSYSDINRSDVSWKHCLEDRFKERTKLIK